MRCLEAEGQADMNINEILGFFLFKYFSIKN